MRSAGPGRTPAPRSASRLAGPAARAVGLVDSKLFALREQLTAGQRWTAALAMTLACAVLLYGTPAGRVALPAVSRPAATPPVPSAPSPDDPAAGTAGSPAPHGSTAAMPDAAAIASAPAPTSKPTEPGATAGGATPVADGPPPIGGQRLAATALVAGAGAPRDGAVHTEADVARAFLDAAPFPVTLVEVNGRGRALCPEVAAKGPVVLVGEGIDPGLVECLVDAGTAVAGAAEVGDRPPASGGGQVLSTVRGSIASLADAGRWGRRHGALAGPVGVVASHQGRWVDAAVAALGRAGVDVRAVARPDGVAAVTDGVQAFAAAGVGTVLFAAPVAVQRQWATQHAVVDPDVRFVVTDVAGGVIDERYPPVFDGALAHTALRVPWYEREHGPTPQQVSCRRAWEEMATPSTTATSRELSWVYSWCQNVALVEAAFAAVRRGASLPSALRGTRLASPLTSDVGPLPAGGWGPSADAVLVWRAACACWTEARPFAPR